LTFALLVLFIFSGVGQMAYMHKQTFDISPKGEFYMDASVINDYFHVDDLIALPIQILNRKGYMTRGCCAGVHANPIPTITNPDDLLTAVCWVMFEDNISLPYVPLGFVKEFNNIDLKSRAKNVKRDKKSLRDTALIISHKSEDFRYKLLFGCNENDNTIYTIWRETFEAIEKLYKWALDLPDFKS
jgi:hypothetical protein